MGREGQLVIKFENVSKVFDSKGKEVLAVDDVSLDVEKGEIFGIIGFSGAGKSTLLRLVNLLEVPTSGKMIVDDKDISTLSNKDLRKLRRRIGMIFQSFNLFSSKTVAGNIAYPLKLGNYKKSEIDSKVKEMLKFVGLEDKAKHYPEQLSGGQKQRVGIARALATSPHFLICDEATSALDPETTDEILALLKKVNEEYDITILLITHEMHVIKSICNRVAVMEKGRVIEQNSVFEIFSNPVTKTTKNFIGSVLNDRISIELLTRLREKHTGNLYRIIFKGESTNKPLLSRTTRKFDVDFNIAYGSIHDLQGKLFGNLIVEFIGEEENINDVLQSLSSTVNVTEVTGYEG